MATGKQYDIRTKVSEQVHKDIRRYQALRLVNDDAKITFLEACQELIQSGLEAHRHISPQETPIPNRS